MNEFEQRLLGVLDALNETFELSVELEGGAQLELPERTAAPEQVVSTDVPTRSDDDEGGDGVEVEAAVEVTPPVQTAVEDPPDGERMVTRITINRLRDGVDGAAFVERFCELFGPLVEQISDGRRAVVFEEGRGLTVRRVDED